MALARVPPGEVDHTVVDRLLGPVDVLDEVDQAAGGSGRSGVALCGGLLGGLFLGGLRCLGGVADDPRRSPPDSVTRSSVSARDGQALVEERHLLEGEWRRS